MTDYFYSLEFLIRGRGCENQKHLSAMDVIAWCIADEEREPPKIIAFMFQESR